LRQRGAKVDADDPASTTDDAIVTHSAPNLVVKDALSQTGFTPVNALGGTPRRRLQHLPHAHYTAQTRRDRPTGWVDCRQFQGTNGRGWACLV
jgi:hypothetical protein